MSEVFDPTLLERIVPSAPKLWSILEELATLKATLGDISGEDQLRIILRPHEEVELSLKKDAAVIRKRQRLDNALNALTLLEIGCQTGQIDELRVRQTVPPSFEVLTLSEAFFHYTDVYLYFAVRLLAGRLYWSQ
jgi:hypothetical protein